MPVGLYRMDNIALILLHKKYFNNFNRYCTIVFKLSRCSLHNIKVVILSYCNSFDNCHFVHYWLQDRRYWIACADSDDSPSRARRALRARLGSLELLYARAARRLPKAHELLCCRTGRAIITQ